MLTSSSGSNELLRILLPDSSNSIAVEPFLSAKITVYKESLKFDF